MARSHRHDDIIPRCANGHDITGTNELVNDDGFIRCRNCGGAEQAPLTPELRKLIEDHIQCAREAASIEWQTAPHVLEFEELVSAAYLGLVRAAGRWPGYCAENSYDTAHTQWFRVFAIRRCRGAVRDFIRANSVTTRTFRAQQAELNEAGMLDGKSPEELAGITGISVSSVYKIVDAASRTLVPIDNVKEYEVPAAPDGTVFERTVLTALADAFVDLPELQCVVIALSYFAGLSLREIAGLLGMQESAVSELHSLAVLTLHQAMKEAA
jgi:RNA polymerase sigma factor (sigma-70 family)